MNTILDFKKEHLTQMLDSCAKAFAKDKMIIHAIKNVREMIFIGDSVWSVEDFIELPQLAAFNFKILAATIAKEMIESARAHYTYTTEAFMYLLVNGSLKTPEHPELKKKVEVLQAWCKFWKIPISNEVSLKNLWYNELVE